MTAGDRTSHLMDPLFRFAPNQPQQRNPPNPRTHRDCHTHLQTLALAAMFSLMESETEIPPFDIEDFRKRLTDAGMPEAQAEILAEHQAYLHRRYHEKRLRRLRSIKEKIQ